MVCDLADTEHFTRVAVVAVFDHGHININDVANLQNFVVARDTMTDDMIYRGADRFRETVVIEWRRNGFLHLNNMVMAKAVELSGCDAGDDKRSDHFEHFGSEFACDSHFGEFVSCLSLYCHACPLCDESEGHRRGLYLG